MNFQASLRFAKSYFKHWLLKVDEHSIHSPFFYDFYLKVIKGKTDANAFVEIENTRAHLLQNKASINMVDLGASSNHFKGDRRAIGQLAKTSLSPVSLCLLMNRIVQYTNSKKIIELGTSMGIMSLYLAQQKGCSLVTFEGNGSLIDIARTNFEYFQKNNIELREGNIDQTLPQFLQAPTKLDLVWMDANHRYEPTLRYFEWLCKRMAEKGVIVVDDINHSKEMQRAWNQLKNHELVYGSVDIFRCGILFLDPALNKQHFVWAL